MKKWAAGLDAQRKLNAPQLDEAPEEAAPPDFAWMKTQGVNELQNPYAQDDDEEEEDDEDLSQLIPPQFNTSALRARSATSDSTQSLAGLLRQPPPPRFPLPVPPTALSLQTQMAGQQASSPSFRGGDSYFSPVAESPASSRTSTTSGMFAIGAGYMFPKSGPGPQSGVWEGDVNRYTAPAMPRASSRDGPSPSNAYGMSNGRAPRGPSMPAMSQNSQTLAQQQRSRSYSTPDINGQPIRRTPGGSQGNIPAVPGIPQHLHAAHERHDNTIPRSNTGSPRIDLPMRSSTQSPGVQRDRLQPQPAASYGATMAQFPTQPVHPRQMTPGPPGMMQQMGHAHHVPPPLSLNEVGRAPVSPPLNTGMSASMMDNEIPLPTQLKVKVNYDLSNYMTLVVAFSITYQSLIDRIDAKLARFTENGIGRGSLKLRYRDEDGDFVSIDSDDDIQIAFMEWRDGVKNMYNGGVGEIELFCV